MSRTTPHYTQLKTGTCTAFALGRTMRRGLNRIFSFLPTGGIDDTPLALLHMQRERITRENFKSMYLTILFDYFFIHLVQYFNQRQHTEQYDAYDDITDCHNSGYVNPTVSEVFHGKGDPRENELLQSMLEELSVAKLKFVRYKLRKEKRNAANYLRTHIPDVAVIERKDERHMVDCMGFDGETLTLRNAYERLETFTLSKSALLNQTPFQMNGHVYWGDTVGFLVCTSHLERVVRPEIGRMVGTFVNETYLDRARWYLRQLKSLIAPSEAYPVEICELMDRTMRVLFGKSIAPIVREKGRCLGLDEWVKIRNPQVRMASALVEKNEIEGMFDISEDNFNILYQNDPGVALRLFPASAYEYIGALPTFPASKLNPLPEMLDLIERGALRKYLVDILVENAPKSGVSAMLP